MRCSICGDSIPYNRPWHTFDSNAICCGCFQVLSEIITDLQIKCAHEKGQAGSEALAADQTALLFSGV